MKPEMKFVDGMFVVRAAYAVDTDADQKPAAQIALELKLDAAEAISEVAKTDLPWLEALIGQLKG